MAVSSPINTLQESHVIARRVQIFLYDPRPPVGLCRRGVNKGDAGSALEVRNCGRVAINAGEGRSLNVTLYTEKVQGVGSRQHIADTGSGRSGQRPQEPRAERPTEHRRANRTL